MKILHLPMFVVFLLSCELLRHSDAKVKMKKGESIAIAGGYFTYSDRQQKHEVGETNTFSVPDVSVHAKCYCDDTPHVCSSPHDDIGTNFAVHSIGYLDHCPRYEVCSKIRIMPSSTICTGLCIEEPSLVVTFKRSYRNGDHNLSQDFNVPDSIKRFALGNDTIVKILGSQGSVPTLPSGCYIYHNNMTKQFYISEKQINRKNEHDLEKNGWYKVDQDASERDEKLISDLKFSFIPHLTTCLTSFNLTEFHWELKANQYSKNSLVFNDEGQTIQSKYGDVFESVTFSESNRYLTVRNLQEPSILLDVNGFKGPTSEEKFIFQVKVEDESASKEKYLSLDICGKPGTFHGTIRGANTFTVVTRNSSCEKHYISLPKAIIRPLWVSLQYKDERRELWASEQLASEHPSQISPNNIGGRFLQEGFTETSRTQNEASRTTDAGIKTSAVGLPFNVYFFTSYRGSYDSVTIIILTVCAVFAVFAVFVLINFLFLHWGYNKLKKNIFRPAPAKEEPLCMLCQSERKMHFPE